MNCDYVYLGTSNARRGASLDPRLTVVESLSSMIFFSLRAIARKPRPTMLNRGLPIRFF